MATMTGGGSARLGDRECRRSRESAHVDVGGAEKQGFQESRHGSSLENTALCLIVGKGIECGPH